MKKFVAVLQRMSEKTYKSIFTIDEMKQLVKQANIKVRDINDLIASLNHQGYLLKKGSRVYQLLTADC